MSTPQAYDPKWRDQAALAKRARTQMWRRKALERLGGSCVCCGETEFMFLVIDHVNGNGFSHRNRSKRSPAQYYREVAMNGSPYQGHDLQVLCANCNMAKEHPDGCPHQREQVA